MQQRDLRTGMPKVLTTWTIIWYKRNDQNEKLWKTIVKSNNKNKSGRKTPRGQKTMSKNTHRYMAEGHHKMKCEQSSSIISVQFRRKNKKFKN